jgi:uncharacterized phage-associated protein
MKCNAITIANELIDLSGGPSAGALTQLMLMKLVYLSYGYGLALLGDEYPMFDDDVDSVEAWKYGPVIPSVQSVFCSFRANSITRYGTICVGAGGRDEDFVEPHLSPEDDKIKKVIRFVWNNYGKVDVWQLVEWMHAPGSPWNLTYRYGQKKVIPKALILRYFSLLVQKLRNVSKSKQ